MCVYPSHLEKKTKNLESQKPAFVKTMFQEKDFLLYIQTRPPAEVIYRSPTSSRISQPGMATLENIHDIFFLIPPPFVFFFFSWYVCLNPCFIFLPALHGLFSTSRWSSGTASHLQKRTHRGGHG